MGAADMLDGAMSERDRIAAEESYHRVFIGTYMGETVVADSVYSQFSDDSPSLNYTTNNTAED